MQTILLIIIGILVGIGSAVFLLRKKTAPAAADDTGLKLLLQQMNELTRTVDMKLGESSKSTRNAPPLTPPDCKRGKHKNFPACTQEGTEGWCILHCVILNLFQDPASLHFQKNM